MSNKKDYFKLQHQKTFKQATRIPKAQETIDEQFESLRSKYPVRVLRGADNSLFIREEERKSHMHIIGTTREGKSKFLEYLIRGDIDLGNGLVFLDPSDRGETMYKVLAYCAEKKHKKVLVIDPHHHRLYNKVPAINPFGKNKEESVANVMDTFRVLYQQKDWADTPIIRRYLKAILSVLWNGNCTVADSVYFSESKFRFQRDLILQRTDEDDRQRAMIEYAFHNRAFLLEYQSTVRRLEEVFHPTLSAILGSTEGIDFARLIADKWVLLVNLYAGHGFEEIHTRLLGTLVINEIISSLDKLGDHGWKGIYYLYLDEAGRYANRNLAGLLSYKSKSGLRVVLAHQYGKQFEDPHISEAVKELCKIKVAFYQPGVTDRTDTVRHMFGGELKDRDVIYRLSMLKSRQCVIKKPKQPPMIVDVQDTPDVKIDWKPYLEQIYENPIYKTPEEVSEKQNQRLYAKPSYIPPKETPKTTTRPASKATAPRRPAQKPTEREDPFRRLRKDEVSNPEDDSK